MDHQLGRLADRYDQQLQQILSPPPTPANLIAARKSEETLKTARDKVSRALRTAEANCQQVAAERPDGLRAKLDGTRGRWEQKNAAAATMCARLGKKLESLQQRLDTVRDTIAVTQGAERSRHRRSVQEPGNLQRADSLRRKIAGIEKARGRLQTNPALAWGGMIMVMAAVALAASQEALEQEFGAGPMPSLLPLTDLWGVGILQRPHQ